MRYRPEVDGLRAVAVVPVLMFHAGFSAFEGGYLGVDVFFVISGFLITGLLLGEMESGTFSFFNFIGRRIKRIFPALFTVVASTIPFALLLMNTNDLRSYFRSVASTAGMVSNFLFWFERGYFDTRSELKPLLHTWSLGVEEQFYIFYPLCLYALIRKSPRSIVPTMIALVCLSIPLTEVTSRHFAIDTFFLSPFRVWELLVGALGSFFAHRRPVIANGRLALSGILMVVIPLFIYDDNTLTPSLLTTVPVCGTLLVILWAGSETLVGRVLSSRLFVFVGLLSYSLYLWHQPIFAFYRIWSGGGIEGGAIPILFGLIFALAFLSWRFVETPFRRSRNPEETPSKAIIFGFCALLLFCVVGVVGQLNVVAVALRPEAARRATTVDADHQARQKGIRAGECHFNGHGKNQELSIFLEEWKCTDNDEGLVETGLLVVGDSHSADKAVALRISGFDTWQIGGAGCPLAPSEVGAYRSYCRSILEKARQLAELPEVRAVVLSNRFSSEYLDELEFQEVFSFWGEVGKPVVVFTPMPNFDRQFRNYLLDRESAVMPDYSREELFLELLGERNSGQLASIVVTSELWCPPNGNDFVCQSFGEGRNLMVDGDHLSLAGAKIFGERLVESEFGVQFLSVGSTSQSRDNR